MTYNPIPNFEGREVDGSLVKMSGKAPLDDLTDVVLGIDDRVQLLATYTVVHVGHDVDEKTGKLLRVHTLRPVMMALAPWGKDDDGVLRSLPPALTPASQESAPGPVDPEILARAVKFVVSTQTASVNMLQRKLDLSFIDAAAVMDELESRGVVGAIEKHKQVRDVLFPTADLDDVMEVFEVSEVAS